MKRVEHVNGVAVTLTAASTEIGARHRGLGFWWTIPSDPSGFEGWGINDREALDGARARIDELAYAVALEAEVHH